jgi:hypothetical protein
MAVSRVLAAIVVAGAIVATAHTYAHAATVAPTAAQRACTDVAFYEAHGTHAALNAALTVSERLPWRGLGHDVTSLYWDVRSDRSAEDIAWDKRYIKEDCTKSGK